MKFELHPDAIKRFDECSELLLKALSIKPTYLAKSRSNSFEPEFFISSDLTENIIEYGATSVIDWTGNEIALSFDHEGGQIGLWEDNYKSLLKLAGSIQKTKQLAQYTSEDYDQPLEMQLVSHHFLHHRPNI